MRKYYRHLLIAFVALLLPLVQTSCAQTSQVELRQRVAMYSKPAVVRVVANCSGSFYRKKVDQYYLYVDGGQGSGFFINPKGYIATRSVPQNESECKERLFKRFVADVDPEGKGIAVDEGLTRDGILNIQYSHTVLLPNKTEREFTVERASGPLGEGKDISIIKIEVENAPVLKLSDSDEVQIQDEVVAISYPSTADVPDDANSNAIRGYFNDKSAYEALITGGTISNPNKRLEGSNSPVLQLDMGAGGYGSAGGPVLNTKGEVVGILASSEVDKTFNLLKDGETLKDLLDEENRFPIAIPVSTIRNFIQDSNIANEQTAFDEYYRDGLNRYWKGDYKGAKERFEAVQGSFPEHSEVERLIQETNEKGIEQSVEPEILLWSVLGAVVVGLLGIVGFLMWRKPLSKSSSTSRTNKMPRPPITGFPVDNGLGQSWIELERQDGQSIQLTLNKESHKIGRDPVWSDVEIPLSWEVLSRRHAILKREESGYRIFDGDGKVPSRNGLMINNYTRVDVMHGYLLRSGDTLTIGKDPQEQVRLTYYNSAPTQAMPETKMAK